jgi:hypothetical protein
VACIVNQVVTSVIYDCLVRFVDVQNDRDINSSPVTDTQKPCSSLDRDSVCVGDIYQMCGLLLVVK